MVQFDDKLKEDIRSANDIVDVVSQYCTLLKKGRNYFCVCPFHSEKSPSMSVSPDRQYFHCFGCGAGGDVFSFISRIEGLSFIETMEFLAERAKIPLPTFNAQDDQKNYLKNRMYQVNAEATLFFHERLYTPVAKPAQDYVKKRKLDNKTLQAFKLGYSGDLNELYKHLKSKGFKDEEILATGLVNKNDRGEYIDRYRKRLMFPIMNIQGKVVAFGGRCLIEDKEEMKSKNIPKYINSNENLVYSKKNHLFALNLAKQNNPKQMLVVEGYMDVISLHQRGITNVVASLGTALTEEQGRLLRKYEKVCLSYDSDEAGQTAIMRGLEVLQKQGIDGRVLQMEGAKDPDEYVIKYGAKRFELVVDNSISSIEFRSKVLRNNYNMENATDKIKFLKELSRLLANIDNNLEREIYIDKIAEQNQISRESLYAEVNKLVYNSVANEKLLERAKPMLKQEDIEVKEQTVKTSILKRENMILYLLVNNFKEAGQIIKENISENDFKSEMNKRIFKEIYKIIENGNTEIYKVLANIEDDEFQSTLSQIMVADYEIVSVEKCIEDVVKNYSRDKLNAEKLEIINLLSSPDIDAEKAKELEKKLSEIIIELAKKK